MRAVIDTNVMFSALYDPDSVPADVLRAAHAERVDLVAPETVRDELHRLLADTLRLSPATVAATMKMLPVAWAPEAAIQDAMGRAVRLIRDESDAPVVATALTLGCGIVTGDKDFHAIRRKDLVVWTPRALLETLRRHGPKVRRGRARRR